MTPEEEDYAAQQAIHLMEWVGRKNVSIYKITPASVIWMLNGSPFTSEDLYGVFYQQTHVTT